MTTRGSLGFLAATALAFGGPMLAAPAFAQAGPRQDVVALPAPDDAAAASRAEAGLSLRPFLANLLNQRASARQLETGAPGSAGRYVEHVSQAAGLTLRAAL